MATRTRVPGKVVLGKETLTGYQEDVKNIRVPTHLGRPPPTLGHKKQGKLKADEWRSGSTISLPFTLIRQLDLIDEGDQPMRDTEAPSSRRRELVNNFLHLATAVRIGARRKITRNDIEKYLFHAQEHLRGLRILFPDRDLTPKQHALLHVAQFFYAFGPAPGFWCFPFERFNGEIVKLSSNYKRGA